MYKLKISLRKGLDPGSGEKGFGRRQGRKLGVADKIGKAEH